MILRIDIDRRTLMPLGVVLRRLRRAGYRLRWWSEERSPSRHGWHVEAAVSPAPRTCAEAVALQVLCGSDPEREACNLQRARRVDHDEVKGWWARRWNVLYR